MHQITKIHGDDVFSPEVCRTVQKRHDYEETFNLARKAFAEKQRLTHINNNDNDKENFDPSQVEDPIERQHRGRPSVKRLKSSTEQIKSKKPVMQNKCGKYGIAGHYAPTCKK
ncbi:2054_t:CDS:2 [Dentiscutata erythropus]|uniref:2054_t:CDS:1 n=1 Tax=Dentiscutata erythropus TaxID=1348616 RepID=A0A9N9FQR7_9GLOM|nr:2054_t:CDS:2 [Dentiscutata erythropus]